jgi:hypothetical protein
MNQSPQNLVYSVTIPIKTVSEGNTREHWHKAAVRHSMQKSTVKLFMNYKGQHIRPPCIIKLIRIAPRKLDSDNLQFSLKYIRDTCADFVNPGYAVGRADDHPEIQWLYDQEKGLPKQYAIRIEIQTLS